MHICYIKFTYQRVECRMSVHLLVAIKPFLKEYDPFYLKLLIQYYPLVVIRQQESFQT